MIQKKTILAEATSEISQHTLPLISSLAPEPILPLHLPIVNHQCIATLTTRNSYTSSLVLDGKFLFTGSSNKEIRLWDQNTTLNTILDDDNESLCNTVVAGDGAVKALLVSSNRIFSAHQDRKIRVWKINSIKNGFSKLATLPTLSDRAINYLLLPKNKIDVRRGHDTRTWVQHVDTVSALALSSDESLLYSVSWDKTLKIWRTRDFKCLEYIGNAHDDAINDVTVSKDGHIYTGSSDKKIKAWGKKKGEKHFLLDTLEEHGSGVNALRLSTDDIMYSGDCDGSILVWMTGDNAVMVVVGALKGHTGSILCLAIGSGFLCSGSEDKTVRIWRRAGELFSCLAVLEGHKGSVKCITMAPDPTSSTSDTISTYLLYSASLDCDIKVWRIFLPTDLIMSNDIGL